MANHEIAVSTSVVTSALETTVTLPGSTVTEKGSTVTVTGGASTVTLPALTLTKYSTITEAASCTPVGPITACETTVTHNVPGNNYTATATSIVTQPGTTVTAYQ